MTAEDIVTQLKALENPQNVAGMARFGIRGTKVLGIPMPERRAISKEFLLQHKKELEYRHQVARELWDSGIHEARMMAADIDVPELVTEQQMEAWVNQVDSWDICDQITGTLFDKTPYAYRKAKEWARRKEEFVRRAAFALMAWLAVHDKKASDDQFLAFLPLIQKHATDERNFVKKAVNWALRQIGKRSGELRRPARELALGLKSSENKTARWIGSDAWRELSSR